MCALLLFATLSHAQVDIAAGGGITLASKSDSASLAAIPPTEKGGIYPSISVDVLLKNDYAHKHRLGLNVESSWRYHQGDYYSYEKFRPIFTDVNALYQPQLKNKRIGFDFTAGLGIADTRFYLPSMAPCGSAPGTCYTSSNHFMEQLGAGIHYYVWHRIPNVFIRPEIHYYHIQDNFEFYSGNLLRAGASIGYTFGSH